MLKFISKSQVNKRGWVPLDDIWKKKIKTMIIEHNNKSVFFLDFEVIDVEKTKKAMKLSVRHNKHLENPTKFKDMLFAYNNRKDNKGKYDLEGAILGCFQYLNNLIKKVVVVYWK